MGRFARRVRGHAWRPVTGALVPAGSWTGTAGSGAAPPPLDTTRRGSGFQCHPTGNMLEVPGTWIGYDGLGGGGPHPITIHADTSDMAGIAEVRVYMEGGSVVLRDPVWNPVHSNFGYVFTPYAPSNRAGEAQVVIDIVPVNGYIRRIGPYVLTLNTNGLLTRPEVFVDPVAGTDDLSAGRGQSAGNAWKTVQFALQSCTDASAWKGAIVRLAPGRHAVSQNPAAAQRNANTRQIAVTPTAGHARADVVIAWTDPSGGDPRFYGSKVVGSNSSPGGVQWAAQLVRFQEVTLDAGSFVLWYPAGLGTHWDVHQSDFVDQNGPAGPVDSDPAMKAAWETTGAAVAFPGAGYWQISQVYFRNAEGGQTYLTETRSVNYVQTGARGLRNVSHVGTFDNCYLAAVPITLPGGQKVTACDDTWVSNYTVNLVSGYPQKIHLPSFLTLTSATYNGLNTILTVAENLVGVGTPGGTVANWTITSRNSSQPAQAYKWLNGPNVGRSSGGAGFEASSYDESLSNGGAHLKYQWGYSPAGTQVNASGVTFANVATSGGAASVHYLEKGVPVVFYTTGTLPAGLTAGTTYWVSAAGLTTTAFQVAATQAAALAGTGSIAVSDGGSGTMTFESRCIVVNGDFSTATGGSAANDKIRGFIIAHADPIQLGRVGLLDQVNPQNLTIQNYRCEGDGIGNLFILQTANLNAKAVDANGNFVNAPAVTASAGSTAFSVPPGTPLNLNDFLRVATIAHPAYGESNRVAQYDRASGTGTLGVAFTVDLAGVQCLQIKSLYGLSMQNVIIGEARGAVGQYAQWQDGVANFTVRQCTIVSRRAGTMSPLTCEFGLRNRKGTNATLATFGCEAFLAIDSIFEGISAEDVWPAEARVVNCRMRRASTGTGLPVLDAASTRGEVVFDANWRPTFTGPSQSLSQMRFRWNYNEPAGAESARDIHGAIGASG